MKSESLMKTTFCVAFATLWLSAVARGQGFVNLDFEQAVVRPLDSDGIILDWAIAAPGWSHSDGSDTQFVYYDTTHLGYTQAYTLVDSLAPAYWRPLAGSYSILFRNGDFSYAGGGWRNAFLAQSGSIPADARSVRFLATGYFSVFVNNIEIPMVDLGGNAFGGDVSAFAGTVGELKILNRARPIAAEVGVSVMVDNIFFSPQEAPEPSVLGLFGLGALLLGWRLPSKVGM